jgi:hypothetical protein
MFLAALQVREIQISQFVPPQTTAEQNSQNCAIPFAFEIDVAGRLPKPTSLVGGKPISKPDTQLLYAFETADTGSKLRAKEAVGRLVGEPSYSGDSSVYGSRR